MSRYCHLPVFPLLPFSFCFSRQAFICLSAGKSISLFLCSSLYSRGNACKPHAPLPTEKDELSPQEALARGQGAGEERPPPCPRFWGASLGVAGSSARLLSCQGPYSGSDAPSGLFPSSNQSGSYSPLLLISGLLQRLLCGF